MLKRLREIDPVLASRILFIFFIGLALFFAGTTVYFYNKLQSTQPSKTVLAEKTKQNPLSILDTIGQFMELPKGEDPVIATVTDPARLQDQQFFGKAQKGDKVIIFPKSNLVILFRPSTNKIIQAGPGTDQTSAAQPEQVIEATPTTAPTATPAIEISTTPAPSQ
jgi:hypothetical protein